MLQQGRGTKGTVGTVASGLPADLSALPEVLFAEDLGAVFRVSLSQARQNLAAGLYGPRFRIGKRWGMLRTALLDHLSKMSAMPTEPVSTVPARGTAVLDLVSTRRTRIPETK